MSDPALTVLLILLAVLIFGAEPLAAKGFAPPVALLNFVSEVLVVVIVLGSRHRSALIVVALAVQLCPAVILARMVTLYTDTRHTTDPGRDADRGRDDP